MWVSISTATFPPPFYTSRHAHFIVRGSASQGQLNKGAWVRGSLPVETPAPGQGQVGPFLGPAPASLRVQLIPALCLTFPTDKGGALPGRALWGEGAPSSFGFLHLRCPGAPATYEARANRRRSKLRWSGWGSPVLRPHVCSSFFSSVLRRPAPSWREDGNPSVRNSLNAMLMAYPEPTRHSLGARLGIRKHKEDLSLGEGAGAASRSLGRRLPVLCSQQPLPGNLKFKLKSWRPPPPLPATSGPTSGG